MHGDGAGRLIGHGERDVAGLRAAGCGSGARTAAQLRWADKIAGKEGRTPRRGGQPIEAVELDVVGGRLAFVQVQLIGPHGQGHIKDRHLGRRHSGAVDDEIVETRCQVDGRHEIEFTARSSQRPDGICADVKVGVERVVVEVAANCAQLALGQDGVCPKNARLNEEAIACEPVRVSGLIIEEINPTLQILDLSGILRRLRSALQLLDALVSLLYLVICQLRYIGGREAVDDIVNLIPQVVLVFFEVVPRSPIEIFVGDILGFVEIKFEIAGQVPQMCQIFEILCLDGSRDFWRDEIAG